VFRRIRRSWRGLYRKLVVVRRWCRGGGDTFVSVVFFTTVMKLELHTTVDYYD
jgi:hypothetical protein